MRLILRKTVFPITIAIVSKFSFQDTIFSIVTIKVWFTVADNIFLKHTFTDVNHICRVGSVCLTFIASDVEWRVRWWWLHECVVWWLQSRFGNFSKLASRTFPPGRTVAEHVSRSEKSENRKKSNLNQTFFYQAVNFYENLDRYHHALLAF